MSTQSLQDQIHDAVVAALGPAAYNTRFRPFGQNELPAINALPSQEEADYDQSTADVERKYSFDVRYIVAAVDQANKAADTLYVTGTRALRSDPVLTSLVKRVIERGRKWEMEQGELQHLALVVTYEAEFSTQRNDPSLPGY